MGFEFDSRGGGVKEAASGEETVPSNDDVLIELGLNGGLYYPSVQPTNMNDWGPATFLKDNHQVLDPSTPYNGGVWYFTYYDDYAGNTIDDWVIRVKNDRSSELEIAYSVVEL